MLVYILFPFMGSIFVAIAIGFYCYARYQQRKVQWLKQHGDCLQAEIIGIER